ncbi:MAG: tetratricopeptide repeat protein [Bacteroidales bacterium]|nr:tetratricopeptide repeat protein [Bacteroidales bacterium]
MKGLLYIKFILFVGIFIFTYQIIKSQDSTKIDSLKTLITLTNQDSIKINLFQKLFWEYRRSDPEKALEYANKSLQLSKSIDDIKGITNGLHLCGIIKKVQGDYIEASKLFEEAKSNFQKLNDTLGMVNCLTDLGDIYNKQNDYEGALKYLNEARSLLILTNNLEKLARIYSMLGSIYTSQKQYEKALEYHKKSLDLNEAENFRLGMAVNYNNMGNVYLQLEEYNEARNNYLKSLEIKHEINDNVGIASTLNNLGIISVQKKHYTDAIDYHKLSLAKYSELHDQSGMAMCLVNLANDYLESGNPLMAIDYAQKGLAITREYNLKKSQTEAYRILSEAHSKLQNFEHAYHFHKLYKSYNDSIQNVEVVKQITEMESKFENEKKENEIAVLNAENEKQELKLQKQRSQRNLMIGLTAFVLVIFVILIWNFRNKQKINKKLKELNLIKSRFFANISHEFRTPLTLLLGPLEKLLKNPKQEEKELIKIMHRNASRLLMLDNQLLDLSKLESGKLKLEVFKDDIIKVLKGMAMSFQSLAEKQKIDFQIHFPNNEIEAWFDHDKLEKIVYNLLSNAMKFTPEKGKVAFDLSFISDRKNHPGTIRKIPGQIICISVIDTGPGISEEHQTFIFDRFYQVDSKLNRKFEGTGLGLSLTKELVELHHGFIDLESTPGEGSVFRVYLPVEERAYAVEEIVTEPSINNISKDIEFPSGIDDRIEDLEDQDPFEKSIDKSACEYQILIVEDNPDMRRYISDCFDSRYKILEAVDGEKGLQTAVKAIPDLIISDLMMPEMDGTELCKNLKSDVRTSHIPVILLTALASVEDRIKGLETGADDYIAKPFNRQELQTRVHNLIFQRKKLIERFSKSVRLEPKDIAITSLDEQFIEKLISRIEKDLANPDLNLEVLIEEAHLSRSQLHRKLKALTGMSATEFIRAIRLKRAAQLLEQQYGTIAETVYAVGFNNLSYFSKCFQKQFGVSPKEYIENKSTLQDKN